MNKRMRQYIGLFSAVLMYYITIAMLLIDPLYLSVLCGFFGGSFFQNTVGQKNGIDCQQEVLNLWSNLDITMRSDD